MSEITYGITEEKYTLNGKNRISYGIAAYADSNICGTLTVIASVQDITADKEKLEAFIETCNRLKLCTIHLDDAVEDFLAN